MFLICAIVALCSCGKSNEEKARELIEAKLKTTMNDWNSYEFVEMSSVDTLYTLFMKSEEGIALDKELSQLRRKKVEYEVNAGYTSIYGERAIVMQDSLPIIKSMIDSLQNLYYKKEDEYKGDFDGFKTKFTFRGNNKMGSKVLNSSIYLFDKDITKITNEFSLDK